jgi:hypothetical protein
MYDAGKAFPNGHGQTGPFGAVLAKQAELAVLTALVLI